MKNVDLTIKDRYNDASYSLDEKEAKNVIVNGKTGNSINYDDVDFSSIISMIAQSKYFLTKSLSVNDKENFD